MLLIIDNVLNSYFTFCQPKPHSWGLFVLSHFYKIIEDTKDVQ